MEPYLTVKEVAVIVRLSVPTIRRYTMNKEIPFHKINRAVRYKKSEIELWVEQRKSKKQGTIQRRENNFVLSMWSRIKRAMGLKYE